MTGQPSHLVQVGAPYLYRRGWTKYGGSAIDWTKQLTTAFSGVEWWFDRMVAQWMIAAIEAVTQREMLDEETGVMAYKDLTFLGTKPDLDSPM